MVAVGSPPGAPGRPSPLHGSGTHGPALGGGMVSPHAPPADSPPLATTAGHHHHRQTLATRLCPGAAALSDPAGRSGGEVCMPPGKGVGIKGQRPGGGRGGSLPSHAFWPFHPPPRKAGSVCSPVLLGQGERLRVLGSAPTGRARRRAQGHRAQAAPGLLTTSHLRSDHGQKGVLLQTRCWEHTPAREHLSLARGRKELVLQPQEERFRQPGGGRGLGRHRGGRLS